MEKRTVKMLYEALEAEIEKGNGDKEILLSNDDEGNGYHKLFYFITQPIDMDLSGSELPFSVSVKDAEEKYIIIG